MLKALIFDFDGLLLDTETPEYETWRHFYRRFGHDLPLTLWGQIVGGRAASSFDPLAHLESLTGQRYDAGTVHASLAAEARRLLAVKGPRPGAIALLRAAQKADLRLAVASSSSHAWVEGHLSRLGLSQFFQAVCCRDDVEKTKPFPDLYLAALTAIGVQAAETVALEDSPNGVTAARAAGLRVIAVPNPVTNALQFKTKPDRRYDSLDEVSLDVLYLLAGGAS
jgi:HAD superfamily hydrolase (TIGR01509 family)